MTLRSVHTLSRLGLDQRGPRRSPAPADAMLLGPTDKIIFGVIPSNLTLRASAVYCGARWTPLLKGGGAVTVSLRKGPRRTIMTHKWSRGVLSFG